MKEQVVEWIVIGLYVFGWLILFVFLKLAIEIQRIPFLFRLAWSDGNQKDRKGGRND